MNRRWNHWRSGAQDRTPLLMIMLLGFAFGGGAMGLGELLLRLASVDL